MCLRGLLLVSGLFLGSWALTPEECQPLMTPLSLADPSMMYNRSHFLVGYSTSAVFGAMLKQMESSWCNISPSPSDPTGVVLVHDDKLNGVCMTTTATYYRERHSLSVSEELLLQHLPPAAELRRLSGPQHEHHGPKHGHHAQAAETQHPRWRERRSNLRCLYLLGRETTLKDSDFEDFKKQASCLGFSGEPQFIYDSKNGFCAEGESVTNDLNFDGDE
nr:uncharacterized protein LOC117440985 [Pseudochaenichthys georgianus]